MFFSWLLLPAGTELHFAFRPPKQPVPEAKVAEYTFRVVLDEPLVAYRRATPGRGPDPGSLVDSTCRVTHAHRSSPGHDNAPDRLRYFESVFARSLNSLIKNTYAHYFQNAGAPGRSAFDVVKLEDTGETLGEVRKRKVPPATSWGGGGR